MGRAGILVLAILAALVGAPSLASAATADPPHVTTPRPGATRPDGSGLRADWSRGSLRIDLDAEGERAGTGQAATDGRTGPPTAVITWLAVTGVVLTALLTVAARRRARRIDEAEAILAANETAAILRRRAVRRARILTDEEDPIVASLAIRDASTASHGRSRPDGGSARAAPATRRPARPPSPPGAGQRPR